LATANQFGSSASVLLGNGDRTFQAVKIAATGAGPISVALADFNGDGKLDVVTADYPYYGGGGMSVLLGKGPGTFPRPVTAAAGPGPSAVTAGDFNGDGRPDVAVAIWGAGNVVSVLLNDGAWPAPGAPVLSIKGVSVTEGNSGTTSAVFTVTLS